ncbi:MAG: hypothetical protein HOC74_27435 [Gemmatimonadetes bacterium]|nr:hypothetical protein [Gemmatimonadota bacterium]
MPRELESHPLTDLVSETPSPSSPVEEEELKARVLELSERINGLVDEQAERIDDIAVAQDMAQGVKPYIDRLIALQRLLNPVDRIIVKRDQIQELQAEIAEDVAEVEDISGDMGDQVDSPLLNDLEGEIASVKRDRKLFVSEVIDEEFDAPLQTPGPSGPQTLLQLDVPERFERILGDRFLSLSRLSEILDTPFSREFISEHNRLLDKVWNTVFETAELRPHIQRDRVKTIQKTFCDYALIFRSPQLSSGEDGAEGGVCSLENLRNHFSSFFVNTSQRSLWYTRIPFYRESISRPHWALVDRQYLNCTFKKPSIRLLMYARANELPPRLVRQKTILEDIYDRIVLELALKERFFDPCHSITSSTYQQGKKAPMKQVYSYFKDDCIRISGKRGTPHWRPTKPRWPGVLPSIVFST